MCEGGGSVKEGGSHIHQSAAFSVAFKEPFVSITRFFRSLCPFIAILGVESLALLFLFPFLLRRTVDTSAAFVLTLLARPCLSAHAARPERHSRLRSRIALNQERTAVRFVWRR